MADALTLHLIDLLRGGLPTEAEERQLASTLCFILHTRMDKDDWDPRLTKPTPENVQLVVAKDEDGTLEINEEGSYYAALMAGGAIVVGTLGTPISRRDIALSELRFNAERLVTQILNDMNDTASAPAQYIDPTAKATRSPVPMPLSSPLPPRVEDAVRLRARIPRPTRSQHSTTTSAAASRTAKDEQMPLPPVSQSARRQRKLAYRRQERTPSYEARLQSRGETLNNPPISDDAQFKIDTLVMIHSISKEMASDFLKRNAWDLTNANIALSDAKFHLQQNSNPTPSQPRSYQPSAFSDY